MTSEEKRAWIMAVVTLVAYSAYVFIIVGRSENTPLTEVAYVATLLWNIGSAIVASIVLHIAVTIVSPKEAGQKDQRDREINRFGEYVGQSFVIIGGVAALVMAMAELNHFWIANAIYLAFVLSSLLGSATKIVAYRLGFHPW
ncbi:hypothetical protein JQX13_52495 [Archangium violaceum]|uniref:hypothetical protein n=1 Tax=Archangium violaceum TaxID=83451 RepID=UPI00193BB42C|nr:hypothetical protein [Archangium violaceum]QRK08442.1 hypothetical protein JQX13_52495 [Archangium violaceum]